MRVVTSEQTAFENTLNAAMEFVKFSLKRDINYTGTACFVVNDNVSATTFWKYVQVANHQVQILDGPQNNALVSCTVQSSGDVLLAILGGAMDPVVAFMCGQVIVDNPIALADFAKCFELTPQKLQEFKEFIERAANQLPASATTSTPQTTTTPLTSATPTNDDMVRPITSVLASHTLSFLLSVQKLKSDIDNAIQRLKQTEKYQRAMKTVEDITKYIQSTPTYQTVQTHPAVKYVIDTAMTEYRSERVENTVNNYKQKGVEVATYVVQHLLQESLRPPVTRQDRKQELEAQLQSLREQNRINDLQRQERIAQHLQSNQN